MKSKETKALINNQMGKNPLKLLNNRFLYV